MVRPVGFEPTAFCSGGKSIWAMLLTPQALSSAYEIQRGRVQRFLMPLLMPLFSSCRMRNVPRQANHAALPEDTRSVSPPGYIWPGSLVRGNDVCTRAWYINSKRQLGCIVTSALKRGSFPSLIARRKVVQRSHAKHRAFISLQKGTPPRDPLPAYSASP
jgi:hypothetical protein